MKKFLVLSLVSLMLTGCIAVPAYDSGYYPYYTPHPYGYVVPEASIIFPVYHGWYGYRDGYGFRGGRGFHDGRR